MTKSAKSTVYDIATQRIIEALEKGIVPWKQPWKGGQAPANFITKKAYRGLNRFLLGMLNYTSPYYLTFKQIKEKGGSLKQGEKGYPVFFYSSVDIEEGGEIVDRKGFYRYYTVFNLEQCEGIEIPPVETFDFIPHEKAEQIINGWAGKPELIFAGGGAYYSPIPDRVTMPYKELFDSVEGYYNTAFHEFTHSTGHKSRLNRDMKGLRQDEKSYAKEELIAEMGAGMLLTICNLHTQEQTEQNAAYIASWLTALKNDKKLVLTAAAQAQKAVDMIQGISYTNEVKEQEEIGA